MQHAISSIAGLSLLVANQLRSQRPEVMGIIVTAQDFSSSSSATVDVPKDRAVSASYSFISVVTSGGG